VDAPDAVGELLARGRLVDQRRAAVDDRRVGLQALGLEGHEAQAIEEHSGDQRPLVLRRRLLLDQRGHDHDLAVAPAQRLSQLLGRLTVAACHARVDLAVLLHHAPQHLRRRGLGLELVRVGVQIPLDARPFDPELVEQALSRIAASTSSRPNPLAKPAPARMSATSRILRPSGIVTRSSSARCARTSSARISSGRHVAAEVVFAGRDLAGRRRDATRTI
jgi:hypothetical protein